MPSNQGQWQGADGFRQGNPKRVFDPLPIFNLDPTTPSAEASKTVNIFLSNLTGNLKIAIGVGYFQASNNLPLPNLSLGTIGPLPAGAITFQLWPYTNMGGQKIYGREIFQNPAAPADNGDHPLAVDVPFIWEGPFTLADGLLMQIVTTPSALGGHALSGIIAAVATVEYNGSWWDVAAFTYALGNVQFTGPVPVSLPSQ